MLSTHKLPAPLDTEFLHFLQQHPPGEFSNTLRTLVLEYIQANMRTGIPVSFEPFLGAVLDLFAVLDTAAACMPEAEAEA